MANGELLLSHINAVQMYTYQALRYINEPVKYSIRDLSFYEGSTRFTEVISNFGITQEDKQSLVTQIDHIDYTHLDLPSNYKALIQALVPQEKTYLDIKSDFEFSGVKLARALYDLVDYFNITTYSYKTIRLTDYITSLGGEDTDSEVLSLTNISDILNLVGLPSVLTNVLNYKVTFAEAFPAYVTAQTELMTYFTGIYAGYQTDSYKPNTLPYIAVKI
jgi:hypothetical protein